MLTDFRYDFQLDHFNKSLEKSPFEISQKIDITAEVVEALEKDDARKRQLIKRIAPRMLHKIALEFAGTINSNTHRCFAERKWTYWIVELEKTS